MVKLGTNVEFTDNRIAIKKEIDKKGLDWVREVAAEIESQVIKNSRTDTGDTKRHWKHYMDESQGEAVVGNELENALWEEFGTGEYAVNGDGRKGAWYVPVEGYTGKKKPTFNGKVEIVYAGGKAFYKTNGKKPTRAFTKAFETVKLKAEKRAEEIFGGIGK